MKLFIVGLLFGSVLTFSYFSFTSLENHSLPSQPIIAIDKKPQVDFQKNEQLNQLLVENSELRNELQKLKQLTKPAKNEVAIASSSAANQYLQNSDKIQLALAQSEVRAAEKFFQDNASINLADKVRNNFEQESVDLSWSGKNQEKLESYFHNTKEIFEIVPSSIECRATRCRISVAISDQKQIEHFSTLMSESINKNKNDIPKKLMYLPNESGGSLDFYIARNDDSDLLQ